MHIKSYAKINWIHWCHLLQIRFEFSALWARLAAMGILQQNSKKSCKMVYKFENGYLIFFVSDSIKTLPTKQILD